MDQIERDRKENNCAIRTAAETVNDIASES